jgi:SecD/SecF fusion protein
MGALAAFQATLTLPGIAGIILGIGMAVDANIMIFERIREEQDAGKKPFQAAKAGFDHALAAIVDCHVTTVLAGLILYYIGTGPIRGFAVTLVIGALTSMFAALVVVRVMLHFYFKRNPDRPFKMGRWLANANFRVLEQWRWAIGGSIVLMVAGVVLFAWLPNSRKFGIDFLGGATAKVRPRIPSSRARSPR